MRSYLAVLQGKKPVVVQSFWKHLVRYRLVHCIAGLVALLVGMWFVVYWLQGDVLPQMLEKTTTVLTKLYPDELIISYSPTSGVATNMSGPVVWTTREVYEAINEVLEEKHTDSARDLSGTPKNVLVIDPTAQIDAFASYETMILVTNKYLIANSSNQMRVTPLVSQDPWTASWGIVVDKTMVTNLPTKWTDWLDAHGSEVRGVVTTRWIVIWLLVIPLVALALTTWLSVGMLLVTLLCWWLSKIWVRVSYRTLFTWLSLSYLPVYIIVKLVTITGMVWGGLIGYILMIACLAVYIVRLEETHNDV